ncbi:MAG TPA: MG2 domain-containing protein [Allosphingosinicella sp.]|nr:MG2 domain-containing protein [Allosphingosinicella sp.]
MRGWLSRVAVVLLVLGVAGGIAAYASTPPTVLSATPGTDGGAIARFTLRFSDPMESVGAKGPPPMTMTCAVGGTGRWVDPTTYVWEFEHALPGGLSCKAELKEGLKTLAGRDVTGTRSFPIDSGGPFARAILPNAGNDEIEEDQAFFVAANGPVDRASVAANAYCTVDGIGERIAVDLLPSQTVADVLTKINHWQRRNFLENAGMPGELPDNAKERADALSGIVALKCRRPLPPGRDMALVWPGAIHSPSGRPAGVDKRFDFTVRKEFSAKLTCSRVNPQSGCDPVEAIKVEFTAPVPRAQALAARLDIGGGRQLSPVEPSGHDATLSDVSFKPPVPPAITAKLILPSDLKDESGRLLANARRFPLDVTIADAPPLVKFAAPFGILEAKQGGVLPVTVRGVEPSLMQVVSGVVGGTSRIEADDGTIANWVRKVARTQENDIREEGPDKHKVSVNHTGETALLGTGAGVHPTRLVLPGGGRQFEVVGIPLARPGFYVVELASPVLGRALLGRPATRYVDAAALVTDMAVHFKWGRGTSLVWVTSLDDGTPVGGATIRITDSCNGQSFGSGTTDRFGRLMVHGNLPDPNTASRCEGEENNSHPLMVSARSGDDFSFVLTDWGQGIRPFDFDLPYGWEGAKPLLRTIFDRTLLRAGETIHMKHVFRLPTPQGFRSGGSAKGILTLRHRGSDTKFELPLVLDAAGLGENEWTPPKGSPMGDYDVSATIGDQTIETGQSFRVDEYRLPTMRASVSGPKQKQVRPKQVPVDLYVGYLSGGGSSRAPVKLRTAYEPLNDDPDGWDGWTFGGKAVHEGTVALDEDNEDSGQVPMPEAATLPLTLDAHGALRTSLDVPAFQDSTRMIVEMDYQDADGETLTAGGAVRLYASAVRLGIKPDGWLQRQGDMRLKIAALDVDGKIIAGQRVRVQLYTREILSARRRLIGGFYAFDNSARTTKIDANCSAVTDSHGMAECSLDPGVSGEVIAVATTEDANGNEARAVASVYLAGDNDWWFGGDNGDRMDIIPDAKTYHAGDTAHVQVRMPFRDATALVTVEREGVLSSFVTTISGKDPVVAVPLNGSYAPDVFISVMAVRGRIAGWRLWLADFARKWHLPFFQDAAYPTATVDLAKPSYRIGIAKVRVGWESHELHVAVRAEREAYHVRDQARVGVRVVGPDGKAPQSAEIAFAAVDEALLQLSPNDSWALLDEMMDERPLSVLTSTAQMQVVGKRHYGRKAMATGGGGGGDLSALTRSDFRPVLLWKGRVPLDAQGRAVLTVPLADSLSSYKLVAIATAGDDLFGTGSTSIRTVQDLSLYSGVPPLVRTGDFFSALFTLRNGTDHPMKVTATVDLQPAIAKGAPLTVIIPPGGAAPVAWRLTAPAGVDKLHWTVTARSSDGRSTDKIAVDEQVVPAVPEEVWGATYLRIGNGAEVPIAAPAGALPGRGGVDVALAASAAPPLAGVRAYMIAYPFGCFEQRLSKAVALDDRKAWDQEVGDLPTYIAPNGLLRYWPSDNAPGSIALTAYALSITAEDGLPWPDAAKTRLIDAMKSVVDGRLNEEGQGPNDARFLRLAALAALARNGASTSAMLGQAEIPVADMPTAMLADWLVTLDRTPGADPRRKAAAEAALRGRIVFEGTRLDLVDRRVAPWWMMVSDDEMALKAVLAITGRRGWEQDAPKMMIGVALRQRQGHWDTTPSNAWGTIAARRFTAAYPAASTGLTTARLGSLVLTSQLPQVAPIRFPLPSAPSRLLLTHSSAPGPWAMVSVRAAVPLTAPNFAGYRVTREVSFLERHQPNQVSRGDVLKVRITIDAPVDRTWVVVEDPIPAGASIVSGGSNQSALLSARAEGGNAYPDYVERGFDSWRGYFGWLPQGRTIVEYAVRVNGAGRFQLPPTRVIAMYSPEIHASLPNAPLAVAQ